MNIEKPEVIVDTNVPIVASGESPQASQDCQYACRHKLRAIMESSILLLDDSHLILQEYRRNLSMAGKPGVGDAFFRWLWNNQANPQHCRAVPITPDPNREFAEFPDAPALTDFDRSDRKFVAVAIASKTTPEILNAADTDWRQHRAALLQHGIRVTFLCPELMQ